MVQSDEKSIRATLAKTFSEYMQTSSKHMLTYEKYAAKTGK